MKNKIDFKEFAHITGNSKVVLEGYDPDNDKFYVAQTDMRTVQILLNCDTYDFSRKHATFTVFQAYVYINGLSDEEVDSLLTKKFLDIPSRFREAKSLIFNIYELSDKGLIKIDNRNLERTLVNE